MHFIKNGFISTYENKSRFSHPTNFLRTGRIVCYMGVICSKQSHSWPTWLKIKFRRVQCGSKTFLSSLQAYFVVKAESLHLITDFGIQMQQRSYYLAATENKRKSFIIVSCNCVLQNSSRIFQTFILEVKQKYNIKAECIKMDFIVPKISYIIPQHRPVPYV